MASRITRRIETKGYTPVHLVARENSKRLINAGYMRAFKRRERKERTIGGPDFIELNEPVVYERLYDLLYRLGN
jgi:hypothetical protein